MFNDKCHLPIKNPLIIYNKNLYYIKFIFIILVSKSYYLNK